MIYKKAFTLALIFSVTAILSTSLYKQFFKKEAILTINKGDSFDALWKRVDSCQHKGLTESALKIVEVIYTKAKVANNAPQFVKAI